MPTRAEVYEAIDTEREYQNALSAIRGWDDAKRKPAKCVGAYCTLLSVYARRAEDAWADKEGHDAALEVVRKVAGIAVRCMEEHGAPKRRR